MATEFSVDPDLYEEWEEAYGEYQEQVQRVRETHARIGRILANAWRKLMVPALAEAQRGHARLEQATEAVADDLSLRHTHDAPDNDDAYALLTEWEDLALPDWYAPEPETPNVEHLDCKLEVRRSTHEL